MAHRHDHDPTHIDIDPSSILAISPWDDQQLDSTRVTGLRTFVTAPDGIPLLIVRVETSEPGLYGLGCGSAPQRILAIRTVLDSYLAPMTVGRRVDDIEDIHRLFTLSGYWRGDSISNAALAAVDIALWDIKAKRAGVPLHDLFGGRVRGQIPAYGHASGESIDELLDDVDRYVDRGFRHVRCQVGVPGSDTYGAKLSTPDLAARRSARQIPWDSKRYLRTLPEALATVRAHVGSEIELLHDAHERLAPIDAIRLASELETLGLFFLEDPVAPEDMQWLRTLRAQTSVPIAMGETFSDLQQFVPLVADRVIDFARARLSALGGITPVRKLASLCELFGVRLALHGPPDVSPIGHAANLAIDASSLAFGIQESSTFGDDVLEVFPGAHVPANGHYETSSGPGLGVDFDETKAAKYLENFDPVRYAAWALLRSTDGAPTPP